MQAQANTIAYEAAKQFTLGVADLNEGRLENARLRFERVIELDPSYPGSAEKLAETLLAINRLMTPTVAPTPTLTPTPDMRGEEEMYNQIKQHIANKEWDLAIQSIEALRKQNLNYKAVDVDGFYFVSLRNRGVNRILVEGNLEGGIYDLALAERFGPLDTEADSWRLYARMYITGASFWKIDWEQVIYYFSQVAPAFPSMRDGSGMTATERYRRANLEFGQQLAIQEDWCRAQEYLDTAFNISVDPNLQSLVDEVRNKCFESQQPTETPVTPVTSTPEGTPTETPTPPPG